MFLGIIKLEKWEAIYNLNENKKKGTKILNIFLTSTWKELSINQCIQVQNDEVSFLSGVKILDDFYYLSKPLWIMLPSQHLCWWEVAGILFHSRGAHKRARHHS